MRPGLPACPPERERALAAQVARLSAGLAALSQAQASPWSDACRDLARLLAGEGRVTFPADRFASYEDHAAWRSRHALTEEDRRRAEALPHHVGTCAPCLRPARFVDGACDCPGRLTSAARALLHAAIAEAGLCKWSRLRLIGVAGGLADRLAALAGSLADDADVAIADAAVSLPAARRALVPGGVLLATLRLDPELRRGRADWLGWDVLDAARAAGFHRAEALRPWSRELGYMNGSLFFLKAVA